MKIPKIIVIQREMRSITFVENSAVVTCLIRANLENIVLYMK